MSEARADLLSNNSEVAVVPYAGAVDKLVEKLHGEIAVLAALICILVTGFAFYPGISDHRLEFVVSALVLVAVIAMGLIAWRKENRSSSPAHQMPVSVAIKSVEHAGPAILNDKSIRASYLKYKSRRQRKSTRWFMLLGAFLYSVFSLLDWLRAGEVYFWKFAAIRVVVITVILIVWMLSFAAFFERIEGGVLTFGVLVAGAGVLMMIWRVGAAYA